MPLPVYRYFFLLSCLLLFPRPGTAQKINADSLRNLVESTSNDSLRLVALNELAWNTKFTNLQEAETYCLRCIALATKTGQLRARSSAYNTLGLIKNESSRPEEGLRYLKLSLSDKKTIGDKKGMATVLNNIGVAYKNLDSMDLAQKHYEEALALHIELNNLRGQADTYNNLGVINRGRGNWENSNRFFLQSLELRKKINDKNGIATSYNNLNANAFDQAKYTEGLGYLFEAARIFEETGNKVALVAVYGNIAKANKELFRYKTAIDYCNKAIRLGRAIGAQQNLSGVYASLGDVYFQQDHTDKALKAYNQGLVCARDNGFYESHLHLGRGCCYMAGGLYEKALPEIKTAIRLAREKHEDKALARALHQLARLYLEWGQKNRVKNPLNEALRISRNNGYKDLQKLCYITYARYHETAGKDDSLSSAFREKAGQLHDTVFTRTLAERFAEMQTRYETEKKEAEIRLLKQQEQIDALKISRQKAYISRQRYLLVLSLIGLALVMVAGYFYLSNQRLKAHLQKEAAIQSAQEKERLRLAKDIHDDLGSGLSKINFLSELIVQHAHMDAPVRVNATSISETSRKLVTDMRDLIWALNPGNTTLAGLVARMHEYAADYLEDFPLAATLSFPAHTAETPISKEAHRQLLMVLKESLNNAIKHASATAITVRLTIDANDFSLVITDNGKGLPTTGGSGNGLGNMNNRITSLGGRFSINSSPQTGTSISVTVPLEKMTDTTFVVKP